MTNQQVMLIKESWKIVESELDDAGQLFYHHLFDIAPSVRSLFPANIREQSAKLMATLGFVVHNAHQLHLIAQDVRSLGGRHYHYGAQPHHYEAVASSLLHCLKETCGHHWTPETADAWKTAINALRNMMIVAQEEEHQIQNKNPANH